MPICNPYIKDPKNIKWLEDNEMSFIEHLAKSHSMIDIAHTILHIDTLNDTYIEKMIKIIQTNDKKLLKEKKAREKQLEQDPKSLQEPAKTKIEKKNEIFEKAAEAKKQQDDELLD